MRNDDIAYLLRSPVDDDDLTRLHRSPLSAGQADVIPWQQRLNRYSLTWIQALAAARLIGFVNVCWDGGEHAFLLDAIVDPEHRRRGVGAELVRLATREARHAGCAWLHVDFEPTLERFYLEACGLRRTDAGVMQLRD